MSNLEEKKETEKVQAKKTAITEQASKDDASQSKNCAIAVPK